MLPTTYGTTPLTTSTKAETSCPSNINQIACFVVMALVFVGLAVVPRGPAHVHALKLALEIEIPSPAIQVTNCAEVADQSCGGQSGCVYYRTDIEAVAAGLIGEWDSYAANVLDDNAVTAVEQQCISDMLTLGSLQCRDECEQLGYEFEADAAPNLCKNTFLDEMQSVLQPYRQSCIASLLAHEMSRSCMDSDAAPGHVETHTFLWWKASFKVSNSWNHEDCPYFV